MTRCLTKEFMNEETNEGMIALSVLIPVYNSAASLPEVIREIEAHMRTRTAAPEWAPEWTYEVVCVDDGSDVETQEVLNALRSQYDVLTVVTLPHNMGQQEALCRGLERCRGIYVFTMDDDLQHDISDVDALLKAAEQGADLVFGIYENHGGSPMRRWGSGHIGRFFKWRFPSLKGRRVSSVRLIHRSVYQAMLAQRRKRRFVYLSAELIPHARQIENVPVNRRERPYGRSGYTILRCMHIAARLWMYYGIAPRRRRRHTKRILMVGAGHCQVNAIRAIQKRGYEVIAADYAEDSPGKAVADGAILADAFDVAAIQSAACAYAVDGIMTSGTDQPVYTVTAVCTALDLPRDLSLETARQVTHKGAMKAQLAAAGIPAVPYRLLERGADAEHALEGLSGPYVIKPVDSQGQRGIFKVETAREVSERLEATLAFSREGYALVESYYPGPEVTLSGWVSGGVLEVLTVTDRLRFHPERRLGVCVAHRFPAQGAEGYEREIEAQAQRICTAFHIERGPLYVQFLVGDQGVRVNELACRLGGAYEDITIPMVTGVDVLSRVIDCCIDSQAWRNGRGATSHHAGVGAFSTQLFFCRPGVVARHVDIEAFKAIPGVVDARFHFGVGHRFGTVENAVQRAGYFIVSGRDSEAVERRLERAYAALCIEDKSGASLVIPYWEAMTSETF